MVEAREEVGLEVGSGGVVDFTCKFTEPAKTACMHLRLHLWWVDQEMLSN